MALRLTDQLSETEAGMMNNEAYLISRRALVVGALAAGAMPVVPARALAPGGWNLAKLKTVAERTGPDKIAALMISHRGRTVLSEGEVSRPFLLHSMRKSVMSAIYGVGVDSGALNLQTTVGELGIDDDTKLTEAEKKATLLDLLQARSGVYIPTSAESQAMKDKRPPRGSHPPGTYWYYNNWDFNVLGDAYERITGKSVFLAFDHFFAKPLGMQDWDPYKNSFYSYELDAPRFGAYHMELSARDMLRFGELFLAKGSWQGKRILSEKWVAESTRAISKTDFPPAIMGGYGYLWWVANGENGPGGIPPGAYSAAGAGGHFVTVIPTLETVVVVRVNTFDPAIESPIRKPDHYASLIREIVAAHPSLRRVRGAL